MTTRGTVHSRLSQVGRECPSTFSRNPLYTIEADNAETTEFLNSRFGVMVDHEGQSKKLSSLGGGGHNSNSLAKEPGNLNPQHRAANVPKGETKEVVRKKVLFTVTSEDTREFALLMHTVGCGPSTN